MITQVWEPLIWVTCNSLQPSPIKRSSMKWEDTTLLANALPHALPSPSLKSRKQSHCLPSISWGMPELSHAAFNRFPLHIVTSDKTILQGKEEMYLFCRSERERLKLEEPQGLLGDFKDKSALRWLYWSILDSQVRVAGESTHPFAYFLSVIFYGLHEKTSACMLPAVTKMK